jgi:hypothetical protein
VSQPNPFVWPPIDPVRARQAITTAKRDTGHLVFQPSHFLTSEEKDAVRAWFMREGKGCATFNSTLHAIAEVR